MHRRCQNIVALSVPLVGAICAYFVATFLYTLNQDSIREDCKKMSNDIATDIMNDIGTTLLPSVEAEVFSYNHPPGLNLFESISQKSLTVADTLSLVVRTSNQTLSETDLSEIYGEDVVVRPIGDENLPETWAVVYLYPPNPELIGVDINTEKTRVRAIREMLETLSTAIASPLELASGVPGFIVLHPVFKNEEVAGTYISVFRTESFLNRTTASIDELGIMVDGKVVLPNPGGGLNVFSGVYDGKEVTVSIPKYEKSSRSTVFYTVFFCGCTAILFSVVLVFVNMGRIRSKHESDFETRFIADMSHEIRTPMNGISGMAELLNDENLNAASREYVRVIGSCTGTLLSIFNDILDMFKLGAGMMDIKSEPFNPM